MARLRSRLRSGSRRAGEQKVFEGTLVAVRAGIVGTHAGMLLTFEADEARRGLIRERVYALELGTREMDALLDAVIEDPIASKRLALRLARSTRP